MLMVAVDSGWSWQVMSHFPVYHSKVAARLDHSLAHYLGDERDNAEGAAVLNSDDHFVPCPDGSTEAECPTIGTFQQANNDALQPLFEKYGVDIYNAGHVHDCELASQEHFECRTDYVAPMIRCRCSVLAS